MSDAAEIGIELQNKVNAVREDEPGWESIRPANTPPLPSSSIAPAIPR
jgi:hypothetical protein